MPYPEIGISILNRLVATSDMAINAGEFSFSEKPGFQTFLRIPGLENVAGAGLDGYALNKFCKVGVEHLGCLLKAKHFFASVKRQNGRGTDSAYRAGSGLFT